MPRRTPRPIGTHLFLVVFGLVMILPIYYALVTAFKPYDELFLWPPRLLVRRPTLENFAMLFTATGSGWIPITRYVFNSVYTTVATVGLILVIQSMAAYPLAKHRFPGRALVYFLTMAAFMFANEVTTIPRFIVIARLGMLDTTWSLVIPALAKPFMVFLLTSFMTQIPEALLEASKIDGASEWTIYRRVMMPLVKPALATVLIFTFFEIWTDSFSPNVYIRTEALKTLPVVMGTILSGLGSIGRSGAVAAANLLTLLPTVVIFVLVQRHVISTMAYAGIKG